LALVSYFILYLSQKNKKIRRGTRLWVWMILYGLFRALIEQFARDITEWTIGPITSGAIYSICMIIVGVVMLIYTYAKKYDANIDKNKN